MDQRLIYRNYTRKGSLPAFHIAVKETDLLIHAPKDIRSRATELVLQYRGFIESYIQKYPLFLKTLAPWTASGIFPDIIKEMADAGKNAGVGPMAAVAGAMAQFVGQDLLQEIDEVIIENGGDIFLKTNEPALVGVFAGDSPLSLKIGLKIDTARYPKGVCTSSGTVGHSLSFGKADAVVVVSDSCALADAAATAIGNEVLSEKDIQRAVSFGKQIPGVQGLLVIVKAAVGAWGDVEMVRLNRKKG